MKVKSMLLILCFCAISAQANTITPQQTTIAYDTCFTPGGICTDKIVNAIHSAKNEILVQAYQLTSVPIVKALVEAHGTGKRVVIVLDKSQQHGKRYSAAKYLYNQHIESYIDHKPAIAHNKVIIIDDHLLITGSFNFSKAAQEKNAENLLIIDNKELAATYKSNFIDRLRASKKYTGALSNDIAPSNEDINNMLSSAYKNKN
jgi:phosphatidylserine/phosphatidylglycerophosphate/cardiolipin synthase-like enzyme